MRINNNHLIRINSNSRETTFFFFFNCGIFSCIHQYYGKKVAKLQNPLGFEVYKRSAVEQELHEIMNNNNNNHHGKNFEVTCKAN